MADAGLFVGWGEVVRGRESRGGRDLQRDDRSTSRGLQADGTIESVEPVFLGAARRRSPGLLLPPRRRGEARDAARERASSRQIDHPRRAASSTTSGVRRRRHGRAAPAPRWAAYTEQIARIRLDNLPATTAACDSSRTPPSSSSALAARGLRLRRRRRARLGRPAGRCAAAPSRPTGSRASSRRSTRTGNARPRWLRPCSCASTSARRYGRRSKRRPGPEGGGGQTVVVTLDGIPDDSVRTERWTLGFEEAGDGVYALTGALRELRCHEGRGHQDFAGELRT